MTDPKSQQTGGETVDATPSDANIQSTTSTSAQNPGSSEAQVAIPQIVIQSTSNDEISRRLVRRGQPLPLSDGDFLEVPGSSRPSNRRASFHRRNFPQARRPFGPGNLPLSLTGPVEAFHVPIDPLRMHPTGLTSSTTMPATTATGPPPGSRYDGNPYTPHGREVMAKVEKMLAADKALKPEPKAEGVFKFGRLLETSFYQKLKSPTRLFSKSKPREAIKPHQIRHVMNLEPLPSPSQIPRVPSPRLRQNERINVQKREKALQVLGETPQFGTLPSGSAQSPPSSAEDPFSELSSRGATGAPTAFETRLRATKSAGALLSRATADPFETERVMASNHDSPLPDAPAATSTPLRIPAFPRPPSSIAGAGAQGSPTTPPRTTTTTTTTAAATTTAPPPSSSSTRAPRLSRSTSHLDAAPGARPQQRHARPSADTGADQSAGGRTTPTNTNDANTPAAVAAAAEEGSGAVVVAVPRFALSPRLSGSRRRGWVWAEEEDDEEEGEEDEEREEGEVEVEEVPWWEEEEEEERGEEEEGAMGANACLGVGAGAGAGEAAGVGEGEGGR